MNVTRPIKQVLRDTENVGFINAWLEDNAQGTRTDLARDICRRMDLRDAKGDWQMSTTCKALRDLETQGYWKLPASQSPAKSESPKWSPCRLDQAVPRPWAVPEQVQSIQGLKLVLVGNSPELLRLWNELILSEHPLKEARLVGRQLRYLIASDHGWLGAIGFGSAALFLEARDTWIGWDPTQRIQHLQQVINMARFLIRPSVQCQNLASHILGLCVRRMARDFQKRYGLRPWLIESFVESPTYEGTC